MQRSIFYKPDSLVYPGEFVPCADEESIQYKDIHNNKTLAPKPPVVITELPESFKVEFVIPGVTRDQLLIEVHSNVISVIILNKIKDKLKPEKIKYKEKKLEHPDRTVSIPRNANPEFICAEYKDGVLGIYLPKSKNPPKNLHRRIIAY